MSLKSLLTSTLFISLRLVPSLSLNSFLHLCFLLHRVLRSLSSLLSSVHFILIPSVTSFSYPRFLHYCTQSEGPGLSSFLSHKRPFCFPPLCFLRCHPTPFLNTPVVHSLPLPCCIPYWPRPAEESLCQRLCESGPADLWKQFLGFLFRTS